MELRHLDVAFARFELVPGVVAAAPSPLVVSCHDANTVMVAAALRDLLPTPIGVWLEATPDYPAALVARDVATLSWLVPLRHVVISAGSSPGAHAEVVRALLTNDEVNLRNDVATITGAYNRPAPPEPVLVWASEGEDLVTDGHALHRTSRVEIDAGTLTTFA
jgi:hypothetical protein